MICDVDLCNVSDLILVFGCCVCSTPSTSCLVSESAPPEFHVCVCFCFARSCCVSACSSACVGALVAFVPFECQEVRILGCSVSSCSSDIVGMHGNSIVYSVDAFEECPCAFPTFLGGLLCTLAAFLSDFDACEVVCEGFAPPHVLVS